MVINGMYHCLYNFVIIIYIIYEYIYILVGPDVRSWDLAVITATTSTLKPLNSFNSGPSCLTAVFLLKHFIYIKPEELYQGAQKKDIHRREGKGIVASSWGTEFIQFLAALAILHQDELKNRLNCIRTS